MTQYFTVYSGLRGAYLDSTGLHVASVESLAELRQHLESEAHDIRDSEAIGLNKKAIAALARDAWDSALSARPSALPFVAGYRYAQHGAGSFPFGLFCAPATLAEYDESRGLQRIDAPSHWASALINGDDSGMEDSEIAELEAWLEHEGLAAVSCVDCADESHFAAHYFHVQNRSLGCDLVEFTFQRELDL